MSEHVLKNFYKIEKTPKSLKIYLKDASSNNTWKRVTALEGLEGFSESNIEKLIEIFQEGFESPVVRKKNIPGVTLYALDKDLETIEKIMHESTFTNFEKAFLIILINNTSEDESEIDYRLNFLKSYFNRENELPRNYYAWSEKEAIFGLIPIVKNQTYELFEKLSTLDNSSGNVAWSFNKYDYLLRTIDFLLNSDYLDGDSFTEAFESEIIPKSFEISDKAALRVFNWINMTRYHEVRNISKRFMKIVVDKEFDMSSLYDKDIELIDQRISIGLIPAFFDKNDQIYFEVAGESLGLFTDVAMSAYYTTEEMEFIEKEGESIHDLFGHVPFGEIDNKDAHYPIPEFVSFSLEVGLNNFAKICDWFIDVLSPKLSSHYSKDIVWLLRHKKVVKTLKEKSSKKGFEKFLKNYFPGL